MGQETTGLLQYIDFVHYLFLIDSP